MQARCQDSVTRGAEINFGGTREVYLCKFKSVDQTKKVFSSKIFTTLVSISKFCDFPRILKQRPKKKVFVPKVS